MRARLTIAADGRSSILRTTGFRSRISARRSTCFWFRLPKEATPTSETARQRSARAALSSMIDRGDYWQCAFVIPKGAAEAYPGDGESTPFATRSRPRRAELDRRRRADEIGDLNLLTVTLDRLTRWYRPGLLAIGDAAHAMSPIGGIGINLAVQDAVAAANILAGPLAARRGCRSAARQGSGAADASDAGHPGARRNSAQDR